MTERKTGYDPNKYNGTIDDIDALLGPAETSEGVNSGPAAFEPSTTMLSISHPLARGIAKATGLPTVVVEGNPGDTIEQQAFLAAMAARDHFLPRHFGKTAGKILETSPFKEVEQQFESGQKVDVHKPEHQ